MSIKNWLEADRPREKMLTRGEESLTDSELLAILLGNGVKGKSAIDLARELLSSFNSLSELAASPVRTIMKIKGIGKAKAVKLSAAFQIARRVQAGRSNVNGIFDGPEKVARYYLPLFRDKKKEEFWILLLNSSNVIFKEQKISEGILNASIVHPREVFKTAIVESAASIILLHNHPSGSKEPSKEDIAVTKQVAEAGVLLNIRVLDHIILAGNEYTSLKLRGCID